MKYGKEIRILKREQKTNSIVDEIVFKDDYDFRFELVKERKSKHKYEETN